MNLYLKITFKGEKNAVTWERHREAFSQKIDTAKNNGFLIEKRMVFFCTNKMNWILFYTMTRQKFPKRERMLKYWSKTDNSNNQQNLSKYILLDSSH